MEKVLASDGCEIAFDVQGAGDPLLLLHGFSQSHALWGYFGWIERLACAHLVITPDLRGCGESGKPNTIKEYGIDSHLSDIEAVLSTLAIPHCQVWGWSFGGTLALQMAKHGLGVESVLVAGTYFGKVFTPEYVKQRLAMTIDETSRLRWQGLASWPAVEPHELLCRTSVYSGTNDGDVVKKLESQRKRMESAGVQLRIFPGLGHGELLSRMDVVEAFVTEHLSSR